MSSKSTAPERPESVEIETSAHSGAPFLLLLFLYLASAIWFFVTRVQGGHEEQAALTAICGVILAVIFLVGFFVVQPNNARVLVFFGKYVGSVREAGFYWTNPFMSKHKLSLRANNLASETIKVNDLNGNPIEIGAVVVWRVEDTAKAIFDVEDHHDYVNVQIETAVRELAKAHPYEAHQDGEGPNPGDVISLRDGTDEVAGELTGELQRRLNRAGIEVIEARISHLAYALEIASAMLQRQQAAAIISARRLIVEGAVGMVEQALNDLSKREVLELDDERRATMVTNLLVVLCGQTAPTPVVNAGGVYN